MGRITISRKHLFVIACVLIFLVALGMYHDRRTVWGSNDFDTYFFAGKLVVSGENLYTHEVFKTTISPFLYLPFFAVLISPLTPLGIRGAALVWYVLSVASFFGAFYLSLKVASGGFRPREVFAKRPYLLRIATLVMIFGIWIDNVSLAQVDYIIFFMIMLSLAACEKGRGFLGGVIMSAAGIIKIYPLYFLLYFLAKRRFRAASGMAAGIVLFAVVVPYIALGGGNFTDSMRSWAGIRAAPYVKGTEGRVKDNYARYESQLKPKNQCLSAIVTRYMIRDEGDIAKMKEEDFEYTIYWPHPFSPAQVDAVSKVLMFLVLVVSFSVLDLKRRRADRLFAGVEYSVIMLSMLLLFPMVKSHTFAPLAFPLVMFNIIMTGPDRARSLRGYYLLFLAAVVLYCLQGIEYMQVMGAGGFSVLLMWAVFVKFALEEKKEAPARTP